MFRSVGLSLFGLGLCLATGCAGIGSSRANSLADRIDAWPVKPRSKPVEVASSAPNSDDVVKFQAPSGRVKSSPDDAAAGEFLGHSIEDDRRVLRASHSDDGLDSASRTTAVKHVVAHSNSAKEAVELQGLETSDSPTPSVTASGPLKPAPWSSRPQPSDEPQTTSASQSVATANSGFGKIQQIRAESSPASQSGSWQADLDRLIARAERDVAALPVGSNPATDAEYRRQQVRLRLLYLMAHHPEKSLTAIASLDPAEQEYWQQMIWAMAKSLDAEPSSSPGERSVQVITPVNTALRRLRELADLTLTNTAFCEEISYFGNYKRFPKNEFVPGQPVLFYTEIENFRSELTANGEYRTLLRSIIEVFDSEGRVRWKKTFAATEDLCRNQRRDYFHNYQFSIPERLSLGPYTLKLTVVDDLSGKQATNSVRFLVK
jgi:hypothetical protein